MSETNKTVEEKSENKLIEFTKWFVKKLIILIVGLSVVTGIAVFLYDRFIETPVPMIGLICHQINLPEEEIEERGTWFLVMKKRFEDRPYGLYRGPYYSPNFGIDTGETDLYQQKRFVETKNDSYLFGNPSSEWSILINRKTLGMTVQFKDGSSIDPIIFTCEKISADKFYQLVGEVTKEKKSELKF